MVSVHSSKPYLSQVGLEDVALLKEVWCWGWLLRRDILAHLSSFLSLLHTSHLQLKLWSIVLFLSLRLVLAAMSATVVSHSAYEPKSTPSIYHFWLLCFITTTKEKCTILLSSGYYSLLHNMKVILCLHFKISPDDWNRRDLWLDLRIVQLWKKKCPINLEQTFHQNTICKWQHNCIVTLECWQQRSYLNWGLYNCCGVFWRQKGSKRGCVCQAVLSKANH